MKLYFLAIFLLIALPIEASTTVQMGGTQPGALKFCWGEFFNGDKTTYKGSTETEIYIGGQTAGNSADFMNIFQFNMSIPAGQIIQDAYLCTYKHPTSQGSGYNLWLEGTNVTDFNETFNWGQINASRNGYAMPPTAVPATTNVWVCFNATNATATAYYAGLTNISLVARGVFLPTGDNRMYIYTRNYATDALRPYFNITYTSPPPPTPIVTITSPTNTTYNVMTVHLNASSNIAVTSWFYLLNGGSPTTFSPNTTISASTGFNNLTVWANASGTLGSASVNFTVILPPTPPLTVYQQYLWLFLLLCVIGGSIWLLTRR